MEIKYMQPSELIPYVNNARIHSKEQVAQIAASIKEFGFNNPILTDGDRGVIAGHGRLLAAVELGLDSVPVIELSHLTDTQKRAYILADNKLADNALWDEQLVRVELEAMTADDINPELTGFDLTELGIGIDGIDFPELRTGDKEPFQQMTFILSDEQAKTVKAAIDKSKGMGAFVSDNENSNGNALARICEAFNG